ncbi:NERD domain-containing protein [Salibacterium qingdaonense]|nr:NERD domain-containing protein [Salibacterium qingdaonense]
MEKGLNGEMHFDSQLQGLPDEAAILCDLLFEINNTYFQIDTLLFSPEVVRLFEVKNYEGDFVIENEAWYSAAGYEIKNPLLQLQRNQSLLRQLFQKHHISLPVQSFLIFTHPNFYVYQASPDLPIIFPHQIEPYVSQWKHDTVPLSDESSRAVEKLQALHIETSLFRQLPPFTRKLLQNGIRCRSCSAFLKLPQRTLVCPACGVTESLEKGVIRNTEEWKLLFPEAPLTTRGMHEWCGLNIDKKRIKRILSKNYNRSGYGRRSFFQ